MLCTTVLLLNHIIKFDNCPLVYIINTYDAIRFFAYQSSSKIFWNDVKALNISEEFKKLNQYKCVNSKSKIYIEIMLICMLEWHQYRIRLKHEL